MDPNTPSAGHPQEARCEWVEQMLSRVEGVVRSVRLSAEGNADGDQNEIATGQEEELARLEAEADAVLKAKKAEEAGMAAALEAKYAADKQAADKARREISDEEIKECGILPTKEVLNSLGGFRDFGVAMPKTESRVIHHQRDFFGSLSYAPELIMELAARIRPKDLVSLYAISKDVHRILNGHFTHCMKLCARYQAPEGSKIFRFNLYAPLTIPDPSGRTIPSKPTVVRQVPSLRWLQMVAHREKTVRDILACMARNGHRTPPDTSATLQKVWLVMDVSTTAHRVWMLHNENFFTDKDLFNMQLFFVKLDMRFNDPVGGPALPTLRKLLLGQRGLTPLCKALKRKIFTSQVEVVKAGIRYAYKVREEHEHMPIFDIPPAEIGIGHLEGWGKGRGHLARIDELVPREAVRRGLDLKNWIMNMMLYGYVDTITGKNTPATAEEKYMSDDEDDLAKSRNDRLNGWRKWVQQKQDEFRDEQGNTLMTG